MSIGDIESNGDGLSVTVGDGECVVSGGIKGPGAIGVDGESVDGSCGSAECIGESPVVIACRELSVEG